MDITTEEDLGVPFIKTLDDHRWDRDYNEVLNFNPTSRPAQRLVWASLRASLTREAAKDAELCRAREWMVLAKTLNGTECGYHDVRRRERVPGMQKCGKCLYCVIDYALAVHLSASSPCRHAEELAELRERINVEEVAKVLEPILSPLKYPAGGRPEIARAVSAWLKEGKG